MPKILTYQRVQAYDDVEDCIIKGTVVSGTDRPGEVHIMWDEECYDRGSLGHVAPADMLDQLKMLDERVPLQHRLHLMRVER